jgi:hypothetical protein
VLQQLCTIPSVRCVGAACTGCSQSGSVTSGPCFDVKTCVKVWLLSQVRLACMHEWMFTVWPRYKPWLVSYISVDTSNSCIPGVEVNSPQYCFESVLRPPVGICHPHVQGRILLKSRIEVEAGGRPLLVNLYGHGILVSSHCHCPWPCNAT